MSELWATRQRDTNRLVRLVAPFALDSKRPTPDQLYGICKLTWITENSSSNAAPYIRSTKIPALGLIFKQDFSGLELDEVAERVAGLLRNPEALRVIRTHTGFTNFYKAYRNAARAWIHDHARSLTPMFRAAFRLSSDVEGSDLIRKVEGLEGISRPDNSAARMKAEYLVTPAFFALDGRLRFPMINGNEGVRSLLRALRAAKSPLPYQYQRMVELYGQGGIKDAADLDQAGQDLPDFIATGGSTPTKQLLVEKSTSGTNLPLKDESDIESVQAARTTTSKRLHNALTNRLRAALRAYVLYEGRDKEIMFDAMVKSYDKQNDLLIEVKSSVDIAHVRMAIGQLYSYSHRLGAKDRPHLAVLLPEEPPNAVQELLSWLDIGLLWFEGSELRTTSEWLRCIARHG